MVVGALLGPEETGWSGLAVVVGVRGAHAGCDGGVGLPLFSGLLLCLWSWVRPVVLLPAWWGGGGVGGSGVVGVVGGSGRWASNRFAGCVGLSLSGLGRGLRWGRR